MRFLMLCFAIRAVRSEDAPHPPELMCAQVLARPFFSGAGTTSEPDLQRLVCYLGNSDSASGPSGWLTLLLGYGALRRGLFSPGQRAQVEKIINNHVPSEAAARRLLLKLMPKAELHVHLDGSMRPEFILEQARRQGVDLRQAVPGLLKLAPADVDLTLEHLRTYQGSPQVKVSDFSHFLSLFDLALAVLQTREGLKAAAIDLMGQGHAEHVTHMELRFAPMLHLKRGLSYDDVCHALLEGIAEGRQRYRMTGALIIAAYRDKITEPGFETHAMETADAAVRQAKNQWGIPIGFDLAGFESHDFPLIKFITAFGIAACASQLWITVHAGETPGTHSQDNLLTAADWGIFHRIGHGIGAATLPADTDAKILRKLKRLPLEVCLTSNLQLGCVTNLAAHPLPQLLNAGFRKVTLSCDNRQISGTTLTREFEILTNELGFKLLVRDDNGRLRISSVVKFIAAQAYRAAFLPHAVRSSQAEHHRRWLDLLDSIVPFVFGE